MQLARLRFDRVFDIQRRANRARTWTEFGYETDGKKTYGVSVTGHPAIPVGQSLLVVVDQIARPRRIYCWQNRSTGEVVAVNPTSTVIALSILAVAYLIAALPLWLLNYPLSKSSTNVITGIVLLAGALAVAERILYHWRQIAAYKLLHSGMPAGEA